ncbi:MAG: glycosyltransferase family 39 protein [Anaerolineae bacterium]
MRLSSSFQRLLIVLLVGLLAFAVRWPNLYLIPRTTDETGDINWVLPIVRGETFPLTHNDAYNGIVYPYSMALLFKVFGVNPWIPRGMMAVAGALLAALVAWVAWSMARRIEKEETPGIAVGALSAGLLAVTSFSLVTVNSRIGWSNGLTPLFTTAAIYLTVAAILDGRAWLLVGAGAVWGLALQTHPSTIALLPGVIVWALLQPQARAWLRTRWIWITLGAFLLAYSNMIWVNVIRRGVSVEEGSNPKNAYGLADGVGDYASRFAQLWTQLGRMMAGSYVPVDDRSAPFLLTPLVPVYIVLAVAALAWAAFRRVTAILPAAALSMAVVIAAISHSFESLYDTRYIAPILPLAYIAMGLALGHAWNRWRAGGRVVVALVAAAMILAPLGALAVFYGDSQARGLTNAPFFAIAEAARNEAAQGALIVVDKDMGGTKLGGGGDPARAIDTLMTTMLVPHEFARPDTIRYYLVNSEAPMFLVLDDDTAAALASDAHLTPLDLVGPHLRAYTAPPGK